METVKFLLLLFIIILRVLFFNVCIVLILKNQEGIALGFSRIMFEMLPGMLHEEKIIDIYDFSTVLEWFPACQCFYMGNGISHTLMVKIIVGCILEAAIMYALAYTSYKRKWLIKTTMG